MSKLPYQKNVPCKYGAPMGRRSDLPLDTAEKLHLRHVPFVDDCYDQGGAYWGMPDNLYCAWSEDQVHYLRADSREDAKKSFPNARFFR